MENPNHKSGFISLIGKPNAGKSTLLNALVGEKLSIVTSKAQTTRHRVLGIVNGDDFQVIFSDTPGIIKPVYELHKAMMSFVSTSLEDADVILFVTDIHEKFEQDEVLERLKKTSRSAGIRKIPLIVVLNKVDRASEQEVKDKTEFWNQTLHPAELFPVSALHGTNVPALFKTILERLPVHPAYYDKDALTDRPERFFAAEVIREKIFQNYQQEVPYSTEVVITAFKEDEKIIRIQSEIYVERQTQKGILIGKNGEMLKKTGTAARLDLEKFFGKKVFLEQYVRVEPDWRKRENSLRKFGYRD